MPVVLRWTPTIQDVRQASRTARLALPFAVRNATRLAGLVIAAVVVAVSLLWYPIWGALGGSFGVILVGSFFADRAPWAGNVYVRQPCEATLTADELRLVGTGVVRFTSVWPWSAFRYALESDEQFVLVGAKERSGFVPYVPKQPDTQDQVRQVLAGRLDIRSVPPR